jgi:hypothetical protein
MSNELESDRAMVVIELWWRFRVIGLGTDGVQVAYYCETETESPSSTNGSGHDTGRIAAAEMNLTFGQRGRSKR